MPDRECFFSMLFLLLNVSFYYITNNVRNIFAFMVICLAVFRDMYLKKRDPVTILCYVLPCFMHGTGILLILFRLILPLTRRIKIILMTTIVSMKVIVEYLSDFFSGINSSNIVLELLQNLFTKGSRYYNNYENAWAVTAHNSGSMRLMKYIIVAECIIMVVFVFNNSRMLKEHCLNNEYYEKRSKYLDYLFLILIMGFACVPMYMPEYWRFMVVMILLNGVAIYGITEVENGRMNLFVKYGLCIMSLGYYALAMRDLINNSACSQMIRHAFLCNPVNIILNVLSQRL